ncbi:hypothetical protein [Opitutus terrae]|uniref:Glycosyltransferase RgtA/B/C/D-like domain-containing protein n=1 Tax=Opitutus terrae (strain DSM 11246 / JCM 15787 / PB90-1) TaxID=452637 RepID=B1ZUS8_OPITP|nr:hypothetical protein [Opitutus terrae]ACB74962.1 hypothetical protein Oter_1678 [Opitutus terrae PB90-1]
MAADGAAVVVLAWLTPPAVFNVHDDLEKYFEHPVRMLANGTLTPNPLGSLGAETLGGQAWLHALVLVHLPIEFIGSVEPGSGFLLALALAGFGVPHAGKGVTAAAAGLCLLAINPQVVNVSSVFTGAALMMATALVTADERTDARWPAHVLGLLYAALIALKTTHGAFVVLHGAGLFLAGWLLGFRCVKRVFASGLWALLFLSPWLLLHRALYFAPTTDAPPPPPAAATETVSVFSATVNGYGSTLLHYTLLAALVLIAAAVAVIAGRRRWMVVSASAGAFVAVGVAAGAGYFLVEWIGGPRWFGSYGASRYATASLLAALPAMLLLGRAMMPERARAYWSAGGLVLAGALVIGFWPSLVSRVRDAADLRTSLAYLGQAQPVARGEFASYNRAALSDLTRTNLRAIQDFVPTGAPIAAWVSTPFHLDFARNRIFTIDPAGLTMRWARMPAEVEYVLLQYRGLAVRSRPELEGMITAGASAADRASGFRTLEFMDALQRQAARARILYNDGTYVLMRLPRP